MLFTRYRTPILLIAVLLPSAALVGIAARLIRQENELAERRRLQARRTQVAQAGQALQLRLEQIKPGAPRDSIVVLAAPVENGSFRLPWEAELSARNTRFDELVAAGMVSEYRQQRDSASELYRQAAAMARADHERALVLLHRARLHASDQLFTQLLRTPLAIRDEDGVPLAVYAAARLQKKIPVADTALTPFSPVALYALRPHLAGADSLRNEQQIKEAEHLLNLRRDFAALLTAPRSTRGNAWLVYEPAQWFVRADSSGFIAARIEPLLTGSGVQLAMTPVAGAEPLGSAFPGVYATASTPQEAEPLGTTRLLTLVLLLTVSIAVLSGFLVWRDVDRESRASALRSEFVASVSHELKTPLTAIRMYAELLRMGVDHDPQKRREYLDTVIGESERLTRLINNVLDFSRIERGERRYQLAPVSLHDFAGDLQRAMSYPLQQSGFDLQVNVEAGLPVIQADRDALAQAVLNLLSNAVKFSAGQRTVELNVLRRDGAIAIQVKDRGRGITATARPHLFQKFYRAPEVAAAGIPGAGLGLALVAHVAAAHGGSVDVESEPGAGSTFTIQLPHRS